MGRRRRRRNKERYEDLPEFSLSPRTKRGILIVTFFILALLTLLSFFDQAGSFGQIIGQVMQLIFGWAAVISPLIFLGMAIAFLLAGRKERENEAAVSNVRVYLGGILLTFALTGVLHVIAMRSGPESAFDLVKTHEGGGYFGALVAFPLYSLVDFWASLVILSGTLIIAFITLFNIDLAALFRSSKEMMKPAPVVSGNGVKINQMQDSGFSSSKVAQKNPALGEDEPGTLVSEKLRVHNKTGQEKMDAGEYEILAAKFRKSNWQLPPISVLEESRNSVDSGNIEANVAIILKTLEDFGIPVEMGEVNVGPTVTQYTLRPAQGIKLSQIVALQSDLALALAASSIRIEAPIPGRSLVGIEVPNKATAIVRLKDIIQTEGFLKHKSNLAYALGRDVAGSAMVADLARMPHLLIAGATGTGKSVAINSILISFLYRNSPEELRLIVIDPKRVELNLYNGIPHLLTPVVTDHEKAVNSLKWAVNEMDRRYNTLAAGGKRNILEYNSTAEEKLPYIVIVVDELADLMAVAQADVEAAVVRLAQMARAVGVHLVLATQRPSVDIITGLIKANITARMAFAVASQVDSRTILDMSGAEKLLGSGDMLYITAELGKPKRIQGTYISEKEVKSIVDFVKNQSGEVEYAEGILERQKVGGSIPGFDEDFGDDDPLISEAVAVVRAAGKASASLLQRRLRIGYARAARLLDLMEEKGMIGASDGAKPRDVYFDNEG
ncbi:MAG: DNA translocase FtsK [bacterium]|nr:DNA translocase FtsK [bacterium]